MTFALRGTTAYRHLVSVAALALVVGGCGFGTGSVIAAAAGGGGGGSANAPATPAGLLVLDAKRSPARLQIVMTDAEADRSLVEFFYVLPGETAERHMDRLAANPVELAASRVGITHELAWDFSGEAALPSSGSYVGAVTVIARTRDGLAQTTVVGLGNDAPEVVDVVTPATEANGIADVSFVVSDTSGDAVDIEVEYLEVAAPQLGWRRARPAGSDAADAAAFRGVTAPPAGTRLTFFWDTNSRDPQGAPIGDLVSLERDVRLRFRPTDAATALAEARVTESAPFRVDNNEQPLLQVNNDALLAGGDRRRTVAVPFTVSDAESDRVSVVMQWRRLVDPGYPSLGTTDPVMLQLLLQDEAYVRAKQICRTTGLAVTGTARVLDPRTLRTDDMARSQAWARAQGIVGRSLEVLRSSAAAPVTVSASWVNHLLVPVAVLAARSGTEAVVLDDDGGAGSVLLVDLETGATLRQIAAGIPGTPTAMCRSHTGSSVLVGSQATTGWLLHEVSLIDGTVQERASGLPPLVNAPIRGLCAIGERIALASVDTRVLRIDWSDPAAPTVRTRFDNLVEPWGLVLDPRNRDLVLVAERSHQGSGRVAAWNLRTGMPTGFLPVAAAPVRPSALAIGNDGRELLVLGEPLAGGRTLHRFVLGAANGAFPAVTVPNGAIALAGDRDGACVIVDATNRQFLVQGGVAWRRTITAYDSATMTLTLDRDLAPSSAQVSWRIEVGTGRDVAATPTGRREIVGWDTTEVAGIGPIALRTIAVDTEFGPATETAAGIAFLPDDHETVPFTGVSKILDVVDMDGDGDLDLNGGPQYYRQTSPRTFLTVTPALGGSTLFDANGDGRNDLIVTGTSLLWIFYQQASGTFPASPNVSLSISSSKVQDLNGDGRFDIVHVSGNTITVRLQTPTGTFASPQTITSSAAAGNILGVDIVDLTGDGRPDISVVAREQQISASAWFDCRVSVFAQAANGSFPTAPSFEVLVDDDYTANLVDYGDVDGDGRTDILLSQPFVPDIFIPFIPDHVTVLFQGPNGAFDQRFRYDKNGSGFTSTGLGDVDGDGLLEILGSSAALRQLAPRQFVELTQPTGGRPYFDVDGDGAADEVVGNTVRYRKGRGRLGGNSLALPGTVVADFDGDGLFDAGNASVGSFGGQVQAFLQTPGGAFPTIPDYARGISTGSDSPPGIGLQVGDVSGDGIVDLLSLVVSDPGAFVTAEPILDAANQPATLQTSSLFLNNGGGLMSLRDFDGDGRLDLASSIRQFGIAEFRAYRRAGAGFQQVLQDNAFETSGFAWGDLDGDGRTDLVVGTSDGRARVYLQTVAGQLATPAIVLGSAVSASAQVQVADIDGDGRLDLLLGTGSNGTRVFYGTGSGVPATSVVLDGSVGQAGVADIDGDGDLDVVLANGDLFAQTAPRSFLRIPGPFGVDIDFDFDGELDDVSGFTVQFAGH